MFRLISKFILSLIGWSSEGRFPYHLRKCVVIVAPHTSSWDFIIGVFFRSALRMNQVRYLGKAELFRPPFGFIFRWLGGYPVDRSSSHNLVEEVVKIFDRHEEFSIALSPEGTRKKVDRLKTGFYNIAKLANVPIVMAGLDYKRKLAIFSEPMMVTDDQEADMEKILRFFRPVLGKVPENGLSHL